MDGVNLFLACLICAVCWCGRWTLAADCAYGETTAGCANIDAWDCYTRESECCETCPQLADQFSTGIASCHGTSTQYVGVASATEGGITCQAWSADSPHSHKYHNDSNFPDPSVSAASNYCRAPDGDKPWCYTLNANIRWEYCNIPTCKDCMYGDKKSNCANILAWECYSRESECCYTCPELASQFSTSIADCEYGDKAANCSEILQYPQLQQCYESSRRNQCCDSCYHAKGNNPACLYGDKAHYCSTISSTTKHKCYDLATEKNCCNICPQYKDASKVDCLYGDQTAGCANIDAWECYTRESECCDKCPQLADQFSTGIADCKYGNRDASCDTDNSNAYQCYDENVRRTCCQRCDEFFQQFKQSPVADCEYGDKAANCYEIQQYPQQCYESSRRNQCCDSCFHAKGNNPACLYGDKANNCSTISSTTKHKCYNLATEKNCCNVCPQYKDASKVGCEYGDDSYKLCYASRCHTYTQQRLQKCCDTCVNYVPVSVKTTKTTKTPTTTTTEGSQGNKQKSSGSSAVPIAAGAVGCVVLVAVIIIVVCVVLRRRRGTRSKPKPNLPLSTIQAQPRSPSESSSITRYNIYPPSRPPPKRHTSQPVGAELGKSGAELGKSGAESVKGEEEEEDVYAYINPDDVKSVISEPVNPEYYVLEDGSSPQNNHTGYGQGHGAYSGAQGAYSPGYLAPVQARSVDHRQAYDNPGYKGHTSDVISGANEGAYSSLQNGSVLDEDQYHQYMKLQTDVAPTS